MNTTANEIIELNPAHQAAAPIGARVRNLIAKVKKITTNDEGRLQVVLEAEAMDDNALAQVKNLLVLQQASPVRVAMDPVQPDLFDR